MFCDWSMSRSVEGLGSGGRSGGVLGGCGQIMLWSDLGWANPLTCSGMHDKAGAGRISKKIGTPENRKSYALPIFNKSGVFPTVHEHLCSWILAEISKRLYGHRFSLIFAKMLVILKLCKKTCFSNLGDVPMFLHASQTMQNKNELLLLFSPLLTSLLSFLSVDSNTHSQTSWFQREVVCTLCQGQLMSECSATEGRMA